MCLCPHHLTQRNAWLDYQAPYKAWIEYGSTTSRAGMLSLETYKLRAEERRQRLRTQLDGINTDCRNNCN